jgi:hypothetical protein
VGRGDQRDHALGFLQGVAGVACHFSPPRLGLRAVWGLPGAGKGLHAPGCHSPGPVSGRGHRRSRTKKLAFFVFFEKIKLIFFECQQTSAAEMPDTGDF